MDTILKSLQSRTIIASVVGLVAYLLNHFKIVEGALPTNEIVDQVMAIIPAVSFIAAAFFRARPKVDFESKPS